MNQEALNSLRPENIDTAKTAVQDLVAEVFNKLGAVKVEREGVRLFFPNGIELIKVKVDVTVNPLGLNFLVAIAGEKGVSSASVLGTEDSGATIQSQETLFARHEIVIGGACEASPDPISAKAGDKVVWRNNTNGEVTLNLPPVFSPPGNNVKIPAGGSSRPYTVNGRPGSYGYEYICERDLVPRKGTINIEG